jgi:hypothetical protein
MRRPLQNQTGMQILSTIALFCYSVTFVAGLALGYGLTAVLVKVVDQQIGSIYAAYSF